MIYQHQHIAGAHEDKRMIDLSATIGERCSIWDFARILAHVVLGYGVSIGGGTEIGRGSVIGNRSRIGANCFLPSNSVIGEDVFIGPGVTFTDDKYPRAGNVSYRAQPPFVHDGASIGAGCVIHPGVTIGADALIGAASNVTSDIPAGMLAYGNPARVVGPNPNLARSTAE